MPRQHVPRVKRVGVRRDVFGHLLRGEAVATEEPPCVLRIDCLCLRLSGVEVDVEYLATVHWG
jgi:hypothetical protein